MKRSLFILGVLFFAGLMYYNVQETSSFAVDESSMLTTLELDLTPTLTAAEDEGGGGGGGWCPVDPGTCNIK